MARFEVTQMLSEGIRMARIQSNIASKELATQLERSPAYISKLEKGEIKTIDEEELTAIFNATLPKEDSLAEKINAFLDLLLPQYVKGELGNQLWFQNYDWVICKIPVPAGLAEDIRQLMENENIYASELVAKINSNAELSEENRRNPNVPFNIWRDDFVDGQKQGHFIKLKIEPSDVEDFLSGKTTSVNYLLPYVIVRFLYWMIRFPGEDILFPEKLRMIDEDTETLLHEHGFLSIADKRKRMHNDKLTTELNVLFSSKDPNILPVAQELKPFLETMRILGAEKFCEGLKGLNDTLDWDPAFALKLIRLPFSSLDGLSFTNKKRLLTEIEELIQKYQDMPAAQKGLEFYD